MFVKKVAIIGAGPAGLPSIKECLEEGLEPVCFEKTSDIGGLWNFRSSVEDYVACVNSQTVANISKEAMSYSDFPMPADFPIYPPHRLIMKYFNMYVDKFDLRRYIRFDTEVKRVEKERDYDSSGRWRVTVEKDGRAETMVFDAVMVCIGHHAKPTMASFTGDDKFERKVIHSHQYREGPAGFAGKRVVVIGMGDSALEAACEISEVAEKVFVSTRHGGQWLYHRTWKHGIPWDLSLLSRFSMQMWAWFPTYNTWKREKELEERFDYTLYGIKPSHRVTQQRTMVSDDLPQRMVTGRIKVKPEVKELTPSGVKFVDDTFEDDIDVIIHGTGWTIEFPFLDESILKVGKNNVVDLYHYTFPPDLTHPTLAVIGCAQPSNISLHPLSEMQARYATRLYKGELQLPSKQEMWDAVHDSDKAWRLNFYPSPRHGVEMDGQTLVAAMAEELGCSPDIGKYLLTDPMFAYKLYFGPLVPTQYRLCGRGKWDGAKHSIQTLWDRVAEPLKGGPGQAQGQGRCGCDGVKVMMMLAVVPIVLFLLYKLFF